MAAEIKALFVTEDEKDYASVEQLFATTRGIDITFVLTSEQARSSMGLGDFDVVAAVVGDEASDGYLALSAAQELHPALARVALTSRGSADTWGLAHQTLGRPWDVRKVRIGLLAAVYMGHTGASTELIELVAQARRVPSLPKAYSDIQAEIYSEDPSVERIGAIIRRDAGMSLQILQYVNSPYFGLKQEVSDVAQAAALLGINTISNLVLAIGVFAQTSALDQRFMSTLWGEALQVSALSRTVAKDIGLEGRAVEEAQLAGLLHDVGDMVLFQNWRDRYARIDMFDRTESELDEFGATHADVSAVLCATWGLKRSVVDPVRFHHDPSRMADQTEPSPATAVHAARALVDAGLDSETAPFDFRHLEEVGVAGRTHIWAGLAAA